MLARTACELFSNERWMGTGCRSRDLTGRPCQSLATILSIFVFTKGRSINGVKRMREDFRLSYESLHKFAFAKSSNKIDPRIFLYIMYKLAASPSNTSARSYQIAASEIYVAISFLRIFSYFA